MHVVCLCVKVGMCISLPNQLRFNLKLLVFQRLFSEIIGDYIWQHQNKNAYEMYKVPVPEILKA